MKAKRQNESSLNSVTMLDGSGVHVIATIQNGSSTSGGGSSTLTPAVDATSTSISTGFNAGPVTKTWTHTVTGTSTILVLMADIWQDVAGTGAVATATWKGVSFTKATTTRGNGMASEIWYLAPTSTGSGTMSVTVTGATDAIKFGVASFTGAATSSQLDASSVAASSSGNPSASLTTTTSSDLVIATLSRFSTTNATSNHVSLFRDNATSTLAAGSYQLATSTGSYSDTYTGSANQDWSMVIAAFKAGTVGGGSSSSTASTTIRYVLNDLLGGGNVITDTSGTVVETLDYYPYGGARLDTKTGSFGGEKRKFDSMERDAGSGLDYAQARYYDSTRGQFISEDPIFLGDPKTQNLTDPQSFNSYAFANGNPITRSDPAGLGAFDYTKGFFIGAGAYLKEGAVGFIQSANPFYAQTAYAPANQLQTVQPTTLSAPGATNQSFNNGFLAGLDYTDKLGRVIGVVGAVVPAIGGAEAATALSQLQLNQLRGSAFEGQTFLELQKTQQGVVDQLTLTTTSGVTTRMDFAGRDASGNICLTECKSSAAAPLTRNQAAAFPEIQRSGATVAGQGRPGFPAGMQIPPTSVRIIRP